MPLFRNEVILATAATGLALFAFLLVAVPIFFLVLVAYARLMLWLDLQDPTRGVFRDNENTKERIEN